MTANVVGLCVVLDSLSGCTGVCAMAGAAEQREERVCTYVIYFESLAILFPYLCSLILGDPYCHH